MAMATHPARERQHRRLAGQRQRQRQGRSTPAAPTLPSDVWQALARWHPEQLQLTSRTLSSALAGLWTRRQRWKHMWVLGSAVIYLQYSVILHPERPGKAGRSCLHATRIHTVVVAHTAALSPACSLLLCRITARCPPSLVLWNSSSSSSPAGKQLPLP